MGWWWVVGVGFAADLEADVADGLLVGRWGWVRSGFGSGCSGWVGGGALGLGSQRIWKRM
jgi:hypothetical protein